MASAIVRLRHGDPRRTGLRQATGTVANDDGDEDPYDFAICGTGITGQAEIDAELRIAGTPHASDHMSDAAFGP